MPLVVALAGNNLIRGVKCPKGFAVPKPPERVVASRLNVFLRELVATEDSQQDTKHLDPGHGDCDL